MSHTNKLFRVESKSLEDFSLIYLYFEEDILYQFQPDEYIKIETYELGNYWFNDWQEGLELFLETGEDYAYGANLSYFEVPLETLLTHSNNQIREWAKKKLRGIKWTSITNAS